MVPAPTPGLLSHQVVDEVGEGPDHWHAGKGDAEKDNVEQADAQHIGQPDAPAVHYPRVGVHLAVRQGQKGRVEFSCDRSPLVGIELTEHLPQDAEVRQEIRTIPTLVGWRPLQ
ncbi:hypothetical protein JZ751_013151 [Albula glossodonta]|uniref:Uncharacterized protein n=1 Tax=Albula glossodonta TaxID=121402 RepID=A0A8T2NWV2_9TELE|nr:hypothetical protein JZ751_013151 [Albula glossodonta]